MVGHVVRVEVMRNAYKHLVGKPKGTIYIISLHPVVI
jgi:hypothetical protein